MIVVKKIIGVIFIVEELSVVLLYPWYSIWIEII